MKYIYILVLIFLLMGCEDSNKVKLIQNVMFTNPSIETCIKKRAELIGLTKVEELTEVLCKGGDDYSNLEDFNHFPNLTGVALHSIEAHEVNLDNILFIEEFLVISSEHIRTFTATNSPNLKLIGIENSHRVREILLNELPHLTDLSVRDSVIDVLDIAQIESLEYLSVGTYAIDAFLFDLISPIKHLDLTPNKNLKEVKLSHTMLDTLLLEGLDSLNKLTVNGSELETLNLDLNNLEELTLLSNKISAIDLSYVPNITRLILNENSLTDIDLDLNTKLEYVRLGDNPLSDATIEYLNGIDWIDDLKY